MYTIVRGQLYDITEFVDTHPGGRDLASLAVGRDSTIMYESYHTRLDVVDKYLGQLKQVGDANKLTEELKAGKFGAFDTVPGSDSFVEVYPLPAKSKIFNEIQTRVKKEILPAYGLERGRGGNVLLMHASCVMVYWLASIWAVVHYNTLFAGVLAGLGAAWIGFGVQHTANHGGLTDYPLINRILGFTDDLACNGSSLVWRYHHHVSHHVYTNDVSKDQDVYSSFPMLRFDLAQKREWYHAFQVYYTPVLLLFLYWSAQFADISCLLSERAYGVRFLGLSDFDRRQFWTGKAMHVFVYLLLPIYYHGLASALACFFVFTAVGSFVLSWFFLVSHNVLETKPDLISAAAHKDWGLWQIETSATWGGYWASFFTGGLCYQIEHHLFPGMAHNLYPEIAVIVKEECEKANVPYHGYGDIFSITKMTLSFLHRMGTEDSPTLSTKKIQ